jgi:hypothetical protein
MKRTLQNLLSLLALVLFLASCQDLTGPEGPQGDPGADGADGENGLDAAIVQDTAYALSVALEAVTGGGDDPWAVTVTGVDISDPDAFRHLITGLCSGIEEGDITLDLSGCTGKTFAYTGGVNSADKLRLVAITLPPSLTHIVDGGEGTGAFHGYTRLAGVSAPGLTHIGDYAFYTLNSPTNDLTGIDFPEVLSVGSHAFSCPNLVSISLPKAKTIGDWAFVGDGASFTLTEVNLAQVETIGEYAFYDRRGIASITLPEVITIGNAAFSAGTALKANTALTTLRLPKVQTIGNGAFSFYFGLGTVELPEVIEIGSQAFMYSEALETLSLPKVTSIGASAFAGGDNSQNQSGPNTKLQTLELPAITSIGNLAFAYCTALESLKLGPLVPTAPTTSTIATNGIFRLTTTIAGTIDIKVPAASKSAYETAGWKDVSQSDNTQASTVRFGTNHKAITISTY